MKETKFKFVLRKGKSVVLTQPYDLNFILDEYMTVQMKKFMKILKKNTDVTANESVNHCECSPVFDDWRIINHLQYIGVKDTEGIEIYEDDVIEVTDGDGWVVGEMIVKIEPGFWNQIEIDDRCVGKILGNIHKNPEYRTEENR
jgi:hypothetical protein